MIPNERMPGRRVQSHDRGRAKGSEHFRKQNQALGLKGIWKSGGIDLKEFRKAT